LGSTELSGEAAWLGLVGQHQARWSKSLERFDGRVARVTAEPKFSLGPDDRFFCIGSCFARNIEEKLVCAGLTVLSKGIISPKAEYPHRPSGLVNKFTTHAMRNEVEWQLNRPAIDETFFEERADGWLDLQLAPGARPVSLERAVQRRAYLVDEYFSRIRKASVFVMTLGLNEVWYDARAALHLNAAPHLSSIRRDPDRYTLNVTTVEENVRELERTADLLLRLCPDAKIVITVSPVPMAETFSGRDVVVANSLSKSTLRVAAEAVCNAHPQIDYFPSYEMISNSVRTEVYEPDQLHVLDSAVREVVRAFFQTYLNVGGPEVDFNETVYLGAYPDVDDAVRRGEFTSGFEHWDRHGRAEGRELINMSAVKKAHAAGELPHALPRGVTLG
jgi:hypothetical protein